MSDSLRIAWIGTGVMGAPMAGHLMDAGHALVVHTRTRAKAEALLDRGATWADSPAAAASGADVAMSIVGFPADVEATHLAPAGTLAAEAPPRVIVDLTTSSPALAERVHAAARAKGVGSVDAPVSGGDVGAREATLSIMVGGDDDDVAFARPLLETLGARVVHQGGPGAGQHTKMVNQILVAASMIGACEGLLYAGKAGLDPLTVIESVGAGAAGSWTINNLGPRMVRRDFAPGFYVEHFIKDLGIALDEAGRLGLCLPGLALARQLYEAVRARGHGRDGTQALLLALESLSGAGSRPPLARRGRADHDESARDEPRPGGDHSMAVLMELSRIFIREMTDMQIIELSEIGGDRAFPIVIGLPEAFAIERRLKGTEIRRPQTHDLLASVIRHLDGHLKEIIINDLVDGTFFAKLIVEHNGQDVEIDSRPSDAIALGVAEDVPIYVAEHVLAMTQTDTEPEDEDDDLGESFELDWE